MVVGEQDIETSLDCPVLKGVIQNDGINFGLHQHELFDAVATVFIHRNSDAWMVVQQLPGLVADGLCCALWGGLEIAFGVALITSAEGGYLQAF